jgi:hypothetical protein
MTAISTFVAARPRTLRHVVVLLAVTFVLMASLVTSARAQTSGGGELGPGFVRADAADLGAGTFPGGGLPAREPSTEPPLRWERIPVAAVCVIFRSPPPPEISVRPVSGPGKGWPVIPATPIGVPSETLIVSPLTPLPADAQVIGALVLDVGEDPAVVSDIVVLSRCVGPNEPLLPAPPSAAEIWQETPLPRAAVRASPPGTRDWPGITRMGSDFASDPLGITTAAVDLRGYAVEVLATPIAYGWSFGDGTELIDRTPGAATRVAYLRRGEFPVTRYVVWEGRARLSIYGVDLGMRDLGTVTIPEALPYRVREIRAVLRTPKPRR